METSRENKLGVVDEVQPYTLGQRNSRSAKITGGGVSKHGNQVGHALALRRDTAAVWVIPRRDKAIFILLNVEGNLVHVLDSAVVAYRVDGKAASFFEDAMTCGVAKAEY